MNGSSAAAATVAGAAALLAQARPVARRDALAGLLVGTAQPLAGEPSPRRAPASSTSAPRPRARSPPSPATLALGRSTGAGWRVKASFTLTNLSTRPLRLTLGVAHAGRGRGGRRLLGQPGRVSARRAARACSSASTRSPRRRRRAPRRRTARSLVAVDGGGGIRVPWAIAFGAARRRPDRRARRSPTQSFTRVRHEAGAARASTPAGCSTWRAARDPAGRRGSTSSSGARDGTRSALLARLRDVLPGRYTFGLTGPRPGRPAAAAGRLRAADRRVPRAAGAAEPPAPAVHASGDRTSRILAHSVTAVDSTGLAPSREPVRDRARAAAARRGDLRHRREPRQRPRRVQEGGRGLDPRRHGRRHRRTSSGATASRTTSRAARRRAASATTPTSRSTRSRRSRCG